VRSVLALDGPEVAAVLAGERRLEEDEGPDAVVALTRDRDLLAAVVPPSALVLQRDPTPPPGVHASRWSAEPARALGALPDPDPPVLCFAATEAECAAVTLARLPGRFLAVHPGAGSPAKAWPAERFAALVRRHAAGHRWLLVAGPADGDAADALLSLPGAVVARELPLRVLAAVLSRAGLFVGNDSGVSHLAAAAGAPTLALFGPTDPAQWSPVGPHVETVSSPDHTMDRLTLPTVSAAVGRHRWTDATPAT
jgi:ADP-heptose:LPS heptosyltransferase